MLLDIEEDNDNLIISYYDKNGKVNFKYYSTSNIYNWVICDQDDKKADNFYRNWNGERVKKIKGKNISRYSIINFLDSLSKEDEEEIFGYNFPKTYFFDIEVEITDNYKDSLDAISAKNKVLTIALLAPNHKIIIMGLKELSKKSTDSIASKINEYFSKFNANFEVVYKYFESEYDMIYTFMTSISKIPMLSGWYCIGYDWTYLVNRCRRLGIDPSISSPRGKLNKDNLPLHVGILDYADLYMKWDRSVSIKENLKLETASKQVLGVGKIKYIGSLKSLYENDYEKYIYYNAVDSILVYYIDQKLKTMQIVLTLSNICKISIYKASSPVAITESFLSRAFFAENKVMAVKNIENKKSSQYIGAYVKDPVVGKHRAVACFDYASLYPSIKREFNISPDSFIEKVDKSKINEKRKELFGKCIVTSNGCVYDNTKPSILKRILTDLYSKRKEYKKLYFKYKMLASQCQEKLSNLKNL